MCEIARPITLTSMGMLTATNRNSCMATEARAQCHRWRGMDAAPKAVISRSNKPRALDGAPGPAEAHREAGPEVGGHDRARHLRLRGAEHDGARGQLCGCH